MRKRVFVIFSVFVMLAVLVIPVSAITWGEADTEHTNVGAIVVERIMDDGSIENRQFCSGTLIDESVFLTAGHCTDGISTYITDRKITENVWVNFDPYALNEDTLLDVEEVISHPKYGSFSDPSNPYDVGVLILAEPVTDIEPENLPNGGVLDDLKLDGLLHKQGEGAKFTVVGYGGELGEWPPPDIIYNDERQVAESEYLGLRPVWLHLSQNPKRDNSGTCFGDSGGPVFWTEEDGTEILVGITSWGDAQCVASGFYYRVDIPETLDFINGEIEKLE